MNWYLAYTYGCLYFGIDLVHTRGTSRGQLRHTGAAQDANTEPFGKFVNNFHAEGKDKPCASKICNKYSEKKQQLFSKTWL